MDTAGQQESNTSTHKIEILPDDYANYDLSFKLIVIGDSGVGKSCLTNKATKNTFETAYNTTIGFEFFSFNIKINDKVLKLQIWDTCGQELYRSLITNFDRNSSLAIMVYSITSKESFDNIDTWLKELKLHSNPDAKVFLIGNKQDLEENKVVSTEQGIIIQKNLALVISQRLQQKRDSMQEMYSLKQLKFYMMTIRNTRTELNQFRRMDPSDRHL